jgi:hypothetical protein
MSAMPPATNRPTDFQKPALGLPRRIESTSARARRTRQVSQLTGRVKGTPHKLSVVTCTACSCSACPWVHTWACWRGRKAPVGNRGGRRQPAPQAPWSTTRTAREAATAERRDDDLASRGPTEATVAPPNDSAHQLQSAPTRRHQALCGAGASSPEILLEPPYAKRTAGRRALSAACAS